MIVINKNIKDIYIDVISDEFIKKIFEDGVIKSKDLAKQKIVLEVPFILEEYQNDIINIFKGMCFCEKVMINVDKNIVPYSDRFIIYYFLKIQNCHEIPLIQFLDKLTAVFAVEFANITEIDHVECNINKTDAYYDFDNNNYLQELQKKSFPNNHKSKNKSYKLKNIYDIDDIKTLFNTSQPDCKEYKIDKDFLLNSVNMLLNDYITRAFIEKLYKFYKNKNTVLCVKKYKE